jgi:hypothetical protein
VSYDIIGEDDLRKALSEAVMRFLETVFAGGCSR